MVLAFEPMTPAELGEINRWRWSRAPIARAATTRQRAERCRPPRSSGTRIVWMQATPCVPLTVARRRAKSGWPT